MKKLFTLLFVVITIGASAQTTLVDYWNFNQSDTSLWRVPIKSLVSGTTLNYYGAYADYVTDSNNTTNLRIPETNTATEMALRLRSPYSGPFVMTLPTTGYSGIVVGYGQFKSGSGAPFSTVTYTTDGVNWDSAGLKITIGTLPPTTGLGTYTVTAIAVPLDFVFLDFSDIPAVNNNPNFKIQINFSGATGGNDRFDNITLEGTPIATPLLLQSFDGAISNNAKLWWTSNNEINVKEFVIESSADNKNYTAIGTVEAKGAKGINEYSFESAALKATSYYRLKMIDNNGSYSYSSIVVLKANSSSILSVFPNPAVNSITLSHPKAVNATISILAINGKKVSQTSIAEGATLSSINVSNLPKGTYNVAFSNNGIVTTAQFVK